MEEHTKDPRGIVTQPNNAEAPFWPVELRLIDAEPVVFSRQEEQRINAIAESFKTVRQLQAVCLVRTSGPRFRLVFGRLRYEAACLIGETEIDALVLGSDANVALFKAHEAIFQRAKTPLDEANALLAFEQAMGATHASIAVIVGRDRSYVSEMTKLARKLPVELQERIRALDKPPNRTELQELARLGDPAKQRSAVEAIKDGTTNGEKLKAERAKRKRRKTFNLTTAEQKLRAIVESVSPPANDNERAECGRLIAAFETSAAQLKTLVVGATFSRQSEPATT